MRSNPPPATDVDAVIDAPRTVGLSARREWCR
jgi:hypothetical protein